MQWHKKHFHLGGEVRRGRLSGKEGVHKHTHLVWGGGGGKEH